jgi:hypothetical protein
MAETLPATTTDQSGPLDAGHTTSEYATTKIVIYMGIASMVVGFAVDVLTAVQVLAPNWAWVGVALIIAGKATALLKAFGYDATRASIKKAALVSSAQVAAAKATVPLEPIGETASKVFGTT